MNNTGEPKVHVAFRFHVNLYHSYRGDTPDEKGFGKDIRIIRHIVKTLNKLNANNIPVRGTWDFENLFSLQEIMPAYCPDLIEAIRERVASGKDEINLMSWNNGLTTAMTEREFNTIIERAYTNKAGSGVTDIFGVHPKVVRPQEMMWSPEHIPVYKRHGIEAVSLYFSALPFTTFGSFLKPLPIMQRYNPLLLTDPEEKNSMVLIPTYNSGDVLDNMGLRSWVKRLHRTQKADKEPKDAFVLIDMDADDDFWQGMLPVIKGIIPMAGGLETLVLSIKNIPWLKFSTPEEYLTNHEPVGKISWGMDTADGSFDGIASWAEKRENYKLWTKIENARALERAGYRFIAELRNKKHFKPGNKYDAFTNGTIAKAKQLLDEAFNKRLRLLSTTHFGLSSPLVNKSRLTVAVRLADEIKEAASTAVKFLWGILWRETGEGSAQNKDKSSSEVLLSMPIDGEGGIVSGKSSSLQNINTTSPIIIPAKKVLGEKALDKRKTLPTPPGYERIDILHDFTVFNPIHNKRLSQATTTNNSAERCPTSSARATFKTLKAGNNSIEFLNGEPVSLTTGKASIKTLIKGTPLIRSSFRYRSRLLTIKKWEKTGESRTENWAWILQHGEEKLSVNCRENCTFSVYRLLFITAHIPGVFSAFKVSYPASSSGHYSRRKAEQLERVYDLNLSEVMPCELFPDLTWDNAGALIVRRRGYMGRVSEYRADFHRTTGYKNIDSLNNHVSDSWISVSDGEHGILISQGGSMEKGMAFLPLRVRKKGRLYSVRLNPFGSYYGRQAHYPTARTGLGRLAALLVGSHLAPYAPSFNGETILFSLYFVPFSGSVPSKEITCTAERFSHSPLWGSREMPALNHPYFD